MEDCEETSLSVWHKSVSFHIKKVCEPSAYFDEFFKQNFQRIFAFESYRVLVHEKRTPDLATSLSNGSLCEWYIRNYVSFVSVESPTESISKSTLDQRISFNNQLGVIGGTLGICIGTSLLSFAEIVLFLCIVFKSLYQDSKIAWKKIKSFLRSTPSDVENQSQIINFQTFHI